MPNPIGPDVARAAVSLRASHPAALAREILDLVLDGRTGNLAGFGVALMVGQPFAQLVAEAFNQTMTPAQWAQWANHDADDMLRHMLNGIWACEVLPAFAAAYGLAGGTGLVAQYRLLSSGLRPGWAAALGR